MYSLMHEIFVWCCCYSLGSPKIWKLNFPDKSLVKLLSSENTPENFRSRHNKQKYVIPPKKIRQEMG